MSSRNSSHHSSSRSQSSMSITDSFMSSSSSLSFKDNRLKFLKKSSFKRIQRTFMNLYSYLFSVFPIHYFIFNLMFTLRLLQMFVPSMFYSNKQLYIKGSPTYNVGIFLSIFQRLFPIGTSNEMIEIFGWMYIAFFAIYLFFLVSCGYYFSIKRTLPSYVPKILCITFAIADHLPHSWGMAVVANVASRIPTEFSIARVILITLISLTFLICLAIHQTLNVSTIFFTPLAFKTVQTWPQSTITWLIALSSFFSEYSGDVESKQVKLVLMSCCLLMNIIVFYIMEYRAHFLDIFQGGLFCSVNYVTSFTIACNIVFVDFDMLMPDYLIIIMAIIVFLFYILHHFTRNKIIISSLAILDSLEDDKEKFNQYKSSRKLLPHIFTGFQTNHRYCLSYGVFRDALNIYENDLNLLIAFAKFLAIYPEEYTQLNWVYAMICRYPKKSFLLKYVKIQLMTILMRRESTLSNDLKKKLADITNLIATAKSRIRNAWEAILSTNSSELEPILLSYLAIVQQINLKFTYLQNYHSNNQYALRAQSNYQREVQGNIELANLYREKVRRIKIGQTDDIDQVYLYGRLMFKSIPPHPIFQNYKTKDGQPKIQPNFSDDTSFNSGFSVELNIDNERSSYTQDVQAKLRNMILTMPVPSIRANMILTFMMVILIMLVPFIVIITIISPIENMTQAPVSYMYNIDLLRKSMIHIYGFTVRWVMESPVYGLTSLCDGMADINDDGGIPESVGGACGSNDTIIFFAKKATEAMNRMVQMKRDTSNNVILNEIKKNLFENITTFLKFHSFYSVENVNLSVQQYVIDSVEQAIAIAISVDPVADNFHRSRHILNLLLNAFAFDKIIKSLTDLIVEYLVNHTKQTQDIFSYAKISLVVIFPIMFLTITFVMGQWTRVQKRKYYQCFYALPKTTISRMIESFSMLNGKASEEQSKTEEEIEEAHTEEKAISTLRSGDMGNQWNRLLGIFEIAFVLVAINIVFIIYSCDFFIANSQKYIDSAPLLRTMSESYSDAFTAVLFFTINGWMTAGFSHPAVNDPMILGYFIGKVNSSTNMYKDLFYGNFKKGVPTSSEFFEDFENFEMAKCDHGMDNKSDEHSMYQCLSYDTLYFYYMHLLKKMFNTGPRIGIPTNLSGKNLYMAWHVIISHLYPRFFEPLMDGISIRMLNLMTENKMQLITVCTVLLVLSILITIFYAYRLHQNEVEIKSTLLLLLHAPPDEILQSSYIMAILSGDFSSHDENNSEVNDKAFHEIVNQYPDALIVFNSSGEVLNMNLYAHNLFSKGLKKVPTNISMNETTFEYEGKSMGAQYTKIDSSKTMVLLTDKSRSKEIENMLFNETERKAKLMSQLMPAVLMPKIMANQSNSVSFSVQTVTVTMISLGLKDKDENIFNILREVYICLIQLTKSYHTIESVEFYNDSVMIIGGLFDEVNQQERHTREMIKYSLNAISAIDIIKDKYNNISPTLCGVATGGPVYGGVLSLEIPIFEVCGDVIDLADAMMVRGVQGQIHTTRAVYELIYGRDFNIKERGEMKILNFGNVVTYMVSEKNKI